MTINVAEDPRIKPWMKAILVALIVPSIPIGLYTLAGSALLITFGPGNYAGKWTPGHFLVFAAAISSILIGAGSTLSLTFQSVRPLVGAIILSAFVAIIFLLLVI